MASVERQDVYRCAVVLHLRSHTGDNQHRPECRAVLSMHEHRHPATDVAGENKDEEPVLTPATSADERRQGATAEAVSQPVAANSRVIELLERENDFLRNQISVKGRQIAEQQERAHETNTLINGL